MSSEETKAKIIQISAELFNTKGYSGTSISDIMEATGLKKGGIYNHFKSKEELALAAFDYAFQQISIRTLKVWKKHSNAKDRLLAIVANFSSYIDNPPIFGGCPILNTAIESDDTHPALQKKALEAMNSWRSLICRIIEKGIAKEEINPSTNADEVASVIICTVEGSIMMSKLYRDSIHLDRAIQHLSQYIKTNL
ncbi:MAG: TetR/AcrR family transcriptional regulator [Prochloraceae cyanobacterium]